GRYDVRVCASRLARAVRGPANGADHAAVGVGAKTRDRDARRERSGSRRDELRQELRRYRKSPASASGRRAGGAFRVDAVPAQQRRERGVGLRGGSVRQAPAGRRRRLAYAEQLLGGAVVRLELRVADRPWIRPPVVRVNAKVTRIEALA